MSIVGEVETADPLTPDAPCPRCDAVALQWTEGVEGGLWCSACDTFYTPIGRGGTRRLRQRRRELLRVLVLRTRPRSPLQLRSSRVPP